MKMDKENPANDELRAEYGDSLLKNGVRGKYAERYAKSVKIARLAPDVAAEFANDDAVNEALRLALAVRSKACNVGQYFVDVDQIPVVRQGK